MQLRQWFMGKHVDDINRKRKCHHIPNMGTWFAGKGLAKALSFNNSRDAIRKHLDERWGNEALPNEKEKNYEKETY